MDVSDNESDEDVFNIYSKMIDKDSKGETNGRKNGSKSGGQELSRLRDENKRLQKLLDDYKSDSKAIINKALLLKERDKTSVLETIELLKLNAFLISHLPDAERVLNHYLKLTTLNGGSKSSTSSANNKSKDKRKESIGNDDEDKDQSKTSDARRRSPRKQSKASEGESSNSKRKRLEYLSSDTEPEVKDKDNTKKKPKIGPKSRVGRSPVKKSQSKANDNESQSRDKSADSQTSEKPEDKSAEKVVKRKPGPKRARRPRVEEPKGYFPCTFDPKQCDEIMDTKEHFDFHMSGHYDAKYVCPFCAYTGPTIQTIKRHINTERENAAKYVAENRPLNEDLKAHKDQKIYKCFGCKVCNKIHDKLEKRCEHIDEASDNECDFMHDIDYQFKDHLKRHFNELFKGIKDKDQRRDKIRPIVDKFAEEMYFENNAKKRVLIDKFQSKDKDDKPKDKPIVMSSDDDDWDD